jgi:hypothetical protein
VDVVGERDEGEILYIYIVWLCSQRLAYGIMM